MDVLKETCTSPRHGEVQHVHVTLSVTCKSHNMSLYANRKAGGVHLICLLSLLCSVQMFLRERTCLSACLSFPVQRVTFGYLNPVWDLISILTSAQMCWFTTSHTHVKCQGQNSASKKKRNHSVIPYFEKVFWLHKWPALCFLYFRFNRRPYLL